MNADTRTDAELTTALIAILSTDGDDREHHRAVTESMRAMGWAEAAAYRYSAVWLEKTGAPALVRWQRAWVLETIERFASGAEVPAVAVDAALIEQAEERGASAHGEGMPHIAERDEALIPLLRAAGGGVPDGPFEDWHAVGAMLLAWSRGWDGAKADAEYFAEREQALLDGRRAIREFEDANRERLSALGIVPPLVTPRECAPLPGWNFGSGTSGVIE